MEKHLPDYEVELTVVIGKPCKDVSEADALDYVLGYCTGNDVCSKSIAITFCNDSVFEIRCHSDSTKWPYLSGAFRRVSVRRSVHWADSNYNLRSS